MLTGEVIDRTDKGTRIIRFQSNHFMDDLIKLGEVPLPPYIKKPIEDRDRYQTIFARHDGSSAAPTAGLHFTDETFRALKEKGIEWTYVTLHIGPGTFRPVKAERIKDHDMHSEFYRVTDENLAKIMRVKREGRRIIPVGTTAARTLESVFDEEGRIMGAPGLETDSEGRLIIHPSHQSHALATKHTSRFDDAECVSPPDCVERASLPVEMENRYLTSEKEGPKLIFDKNGKLLHVEDWTDIFIYPGYKFKMVDALITNFHLPRSTLIMLASALSGTDFILKAYREAVRERYRFFSFGDCMFIF